MFLPSNYKVPEKGGYFKLKDGENTFRVLSSAIVGYEYWNVDNKPVRSKEPFLQMPADIRIEKDGTMSKIKHFWAFAVWNVEAEMVQIMEITQSTIQSQIKALIDNKNWGNPTAYDITITRSGEGFDTEYTVMPNPKSATPASATKALKAKPINLDALYDGSDPFLATNGKAETSEELANMDEIGF